MKKPSWRSGFGLGKQIRAGFLVVVISGSAHAESSAVILSVQRPATLNRDGIILVPQPGQNLFPGDKLTAGPKGFLEVVIPDESLDAIRIFGNESWEVPLGASELQLDLPKVWKPGTTVLNFAGLRANFSRLVEESIFYVGLPRWTRIAGDELILWWEGTPLAEASAKLVVFSEEEIVLMETGTNSIMISRADGLIAGQIYHWQLYFSSELKSGQFQFVPTDGMTDIHEKISAVLAKHGDDHENAWIVESAILIESGLFVDAASVLLEVYKSKASEAAYRWLEHVAFYLGQEFSVRAFEWPDPGGRGPLDLDKLRDKLDGQSAGISRR